MIPPLMPSLLSPFPCFSSARLGVLCVLRGERRFLNRPHDRTSAARVGSLLFRAGPDKFFLLIKSAGCAQSFKGLFNSAIFQ